MLCSVHLYCTHNKFESRVTEIDILSIFSAENLPRLSSCCLNLASRAQIFYFRGVENADASNNCGAAKCVLTQNEAEKEAL